MANRKPVKDLIAINFHKNTHKGQIQWPLT